MEENKFKMNTYLRQILVEKNELPKEEIKGKPGCDIMRGTVANAFRADKFDFGVEMFCESEAQAKWMIKNYHEFRSQSLVGDAFGRERVALECDNKNKFEKLLRELVDANGMTIRVGNDYNRGYLEVSGKYDEAVWQKVDMKLDQMQEENRLFYAEYDREM